MKIVSFILGLIISFLLNYLLSLISQILMCDILKIPPDSNSNSTERVTCNNIMINGIISLVIFILFTNTSNYFSKKYIYIKYAFLLVSFFHLVVLNNVIPRILNITTDRYNYKSYLFLGPEKSDNNFGRIDELKLYLVVTLTTLIGINIIYKKL